MLKRLKHYLVSAKTHQSFRRYFANTSWMFAEQILRLVAGLFVGIWVARYLGPRQLGVFGYALAFVAIFGSIAKLGLDEVIRCNIDAKWPALGELVCAHKSLIPKSA